MLEPLRIILPTLARLFRKQQDLLVENLLLRHQTPGRAPFPSSPLPQDQRPVLLAVGPERLPRLEEASHPGTTGNRPPPAPPRLAALLSLTLRTAVGPASIESRDSGSDRQHCEREPALGYRAASVASYSSSASWSVLARSVATAGVATRDRPSQSWRTFLGSHAPAIWAADLSVVQTLSFQTL